MRTDCLLIQCKFRCVLTLRFLQLFPANLLPFLFQALKVFIQCKLIFQLFRQDLLFQQQTGCDLCIFRTVADP